MVHAINEPGLHLTRRIDEAPRSRNYSSAMLELRTGRHLCRAQRQRNFGSREEDAVDSDRKGGLLEHTSRKGTRDAD